MLSSLEMFNIGIGSSSSHTVGPMKAALIFVNLLEAENILPKVKRLQVNLFGSLALTGEGHGTLQAVICGLSGENPKDINSEVFLTRYAEVVKNKKINLLGKHRIFFAVLTDLLLEKTKFLPEHPNAMRFTAIGENNETLLAKEYFSIGGGFVLDKENVGKNNVTKETMAVPYTFKSADELFTLCEINNMSVAQLVIQNELVSKSRIEIDNAVLEIIDAMSDSIKRGITTKMRVLPGGINVKRRTPELYEKLNTPDIQVNIANQRLLAMTYAMAVNEENAAFGKIVTAPTNGSAGTIAGVLEYYKIFCKPETQDKLIEFILTAGAMGILYKSGASISAAEVGCQGEIGVSCSMAAAALTAVLGGSLKQVERAAEIAMEHSLGMTCDPIHGLVQIPCIERNGVAASRAIDIAGMVLHESGEGKVSLDEVIKAMLETGRDMNMHYKETALGGLAVNHVNC